MKTALNTGFTLQTYRGLLERTHSNYTCVGFEILDEPNDLPSQVAIVRHDIDMSPACALSLAKIEAELDIRATYTVLLTGEFYSPFEENTRRILKSIANLGHDIGLHFDAAWHGINTEAELEDAIAWEAAILDRLIDPKGGVKMFSFHNTTSFTMSCKKPRYANLRNAYAGVLQEQVSYTSDSNGYWIHRSWDAILDDSPDRIQVLSHPEWWNEKDAEPAEKVCTHLDARSQAIWHGYCDLLASGGRDNKTGISMAFSVLPALISDDGEYLVRLWLSGKRELAFVDLYCRFERQTRRLLHQYFRSVLCAPANQVNAVLSDDGLRMDPLRAICCIANQPLQSLLGCSDEQYQALKTVQHGLVHGFVSVAKPTLQMQFDLLAVTMCNLDEWSKTHKIQAAGTTKLTTKGMPKVPTTDKDALLTWLKKHQKDLGISDNTLRTLHPQAFSYGEESHL
jgi:hypothetical protein